MREGPCRKGRQGVGLLGANIPGKRRNATKLDGGLLIPPSWASPHPPHMPLSPLQLLLERRGLNTPFTQEGLLVLTVISLTQRKNSCKVSTYCVSGGTSSRSERSIMTTIILTKLSTRCAKAAPSALPAVTPQCLPTTRRWSCLYYPVLQRRRRCAQRHTKNAPQS